MIIPVVSGSRTSCTPTLSPSATSPAPPYAISAPLIFHLPPAKPTSSLASEAGPLPSNLPTGRRVFQSGRVPVPVNPIPSRANARVTPTTVIYGRNSYASFATTVLQYALENRLRERMGKYGSMEYDLTWKSWAMKSGRRICALRASGRRISDKGCIGWPSPQGRDWKGGSLKQLGRNSRPLNEVALLAGWPTARTSDADKSVRTMEGSLREVRRKGGPQDLGAAAFLAGWPTPNLPSGGRVLSIGQTISMKSKKGHKVQVALENVANLALAGWSTPNAISENRGGLQSNPIKAMQRRKDGHQLNLDDQATLAQLQIAGWTGGPTSNSSPASTATTGALNPEHTRYLMGFLPGWSSYAVTETP